MEFPCSFAVKVIGVDSPIFLEDIKKIVLNHFPNFELGSLVYKESGNKNYLAITATVLATSQEMLDLFYQELTRHPDVKMVL